MYMCKLYEEIKGLVNGEFNKVYVKHILTLDGNIQEVILNEYSVPEGVFNKEDIDDMLDYEGGEHIGTYSIEVLNNTPTVVIFHIETTQSRPNDLVKEIGSRKVEDDMSNYETVTKNSVAMSTTYEVQVEKSTKLEVGTLVVGIDENGDPVVRTIDGKRVDAIADYTYNTYIEALYGKIKSLDEKILVYELKNQEKTERLINAEKVWKAMNSENKDLKTRLEKARAYYREQEGKAKVKTPNLGSKITPPQTVNNIPVVNEVSVTNNGQQPVTNNLVCSCCNKQVTQTTRNYCLGHAEFKGKTFCFGCQRKVRSGKATA
jgi:hypothetical protein